jgi:hypothetical protein
MFPDSIPVWVSPNVVGYSGRLDAVIRKIRCEAAKFIRIIRKIRSL